jgi:hypothetical protein
MKQVERKREKCNKKKYTRQDSRSFSSSLKFHTDKKRVSGKTKIPSFFVRFTFNFVNAISQAQKGVFVVGVSTKYCRFFLLFLLAAFHGVRIAEK